MILGWSLLLKTELHGILVHKCEQLFAVCSSLAHVGAEFGKLCKIDADVAHEMVLVRRWQVMAEKTTGEMVLLQLLLLVITTTTNNPIFSTYMLAKVRPWRIPYSRRGMQEFYKEAITKQVYRLVIRGRGVHLEGGNRIFVALPVVGDGGTDFGQLRSGVPCGGGSIVICHTS